MLKKHAIMLATLLLAAGAISLAGCVVYPAPYPYYPYPSYYGGVVVRAPIIVHRHYW